jgi:hypothetical protein
MPKGNMAVRSVQLVTQYQRTETFSQVLLHYHQGAYIVFVKRYKILKLYKAVGR